MDYTGELTRGVLMAMGGLVAVAILVLLASFVVSALFSNSSPEGLWWLVASLPVAASQNKLGRQAEPARR